jgi:crotonobetainyl-CoA:carnitine CoA-transferase CaiB-like acyl-CoA transferase
VQLPLSSLRVLDLTRLLPGPYCTMLLADFGAEVIKIEEPGLGDYARWYEPGWGEESALFTSLNRNKKSVTLNLKLEEGKIIFREMVRRADVVVESFRPGTMERLGLGYDTLKKINPGLIYCAVTGYGQDGPYADQAGHDINYLSYAGLLDLQGEKGRKPTPPAVQIADIGGGAMMAATGILLALLSRYHTGRGQKVDISMLDGVVSWMQTFLPHYLATGQEPRRGELTLSGELACYGVYETADQRYLAVGALEPKFWEVFCRGIEREDLIPRLNAPPKEQEEMKRIIASVIRKRTLSDWMNVFAGKDACVSPVLTVAEMVRDPQVIHRQMIVDTEHPAFGTVRLPGIPIKMSEAAGSIRAFAPSLGEHNREYLMELGYSEEEIDRLKKENII